jgi:hypothetical protein
MFFIKSFLNGLTKKQKIILCVLCVFLAADLVLVVQKYLSPSSAVKLSFPPAMHESSEKLRALNGNARSSSPKAGYAYYKFTKSQKNTFLSYFSEYGDAAVVISIHVKPGKVYDSLAAQGEIPFMYGFLFARDFKKNGSLYGEINKRPLVSADLRGMKDFALSLSVQKDELKKDNTLPDGFFIYTAVPVSITGVAVRGAAVGWDTSGSVPFYGFAPTGGKVQSRSLSVDFSGCSMVFPSQNTPSSVMPDIYLSFRSTEDFGTPDKSASFPINAGGEKYTLFRAKNINSYQIHTSALRNPFARIETDDSSHEVQSVMMVRGESGSITPAGGRVLVPFKTDPGFIIDWPAQHWRTADYELFEWDRFPGVLFFDTRTYDVQNDFFRRLAFYAEKTGYRGSLVSDEVLKNKHAYNAHDYSAETLASFFTKAAAENFKLNEKEYLLRDILLANKVIEKDAGGYKAGKGAVVSVSQDSSLWLRRRFIAHEGWHGIFFTDEKFRNAVAAVFYTMDQTSLDFLMKYWHTQSDLDYDTNDTYLVHNEFMAYLMQQPLPEVADYFVHLANRGSVMKGIPELAAYVRRNNGMQFEDAARVLNEYAFANWGLSCGRVSLVR